MSHWDYSKSQKDYGWDWIISLTSNQHINKRRYPLLMNKTTANIETHRIGLGAPESHFAVTRSHSIFTRDKKYTRKIQNILWFLPRQQNCLENYGCIFTIWEEGNISNRTSRCLSKSYHIPTCGKSESATKPEAHVLPKKEYS